jgi:hypothetical protein
MVLLGTLALGLALGTLTERGKLALSRGLHNLWAVPSHR